MSEVAELNAALVKAQTDFPAITKESTVSTGSYSYTYATLDSILHAVREPLAKNGLALVQMLEGEDGIPRLRTELRHVAGGVIGASFPLPRIPEKPQDLGSLISYLRRYAVLAILSIAPADEDDDAVAANKDAEKNKDKMSVPQRNKIFGCMKDLGTKLKVPPKEPFADWKTAVESYCLEQFEHNLADLTKSEASQVIEMLQKKIAKVMEGGEQSQFNAPEGAANGQEPQPALSAPGDEDIPF